MEQTPIQFAKEFIENLNSETNQFDYSKDINVCFNKDILTNDPNLNVLKQELIKIGFNLTPTDKEGYWKLKKSI